MTRGGLVMPSVRPTVGLVFRIEVRPVRRGGIGSPSGGCGGLRRVAVMKGPAADWHLDTGHR